MKTSDAFRMAQSHGLDLVEISPHAKPPVCRIMDFGKFRYQENRKEKMAKKHQIATTRKEIKFHVNVDENDYTVKLNRIHEFLKKGHHVKTSIMFRGRENEHRDFGFKLMERIIKDCEELGVPEAKPKLFGRLMVMMLRAQNNEKQAKSS